MKYLLTLLSMIALLVTGNCARAERNLEEDLSSCEGLMRLIPELKNAEGKFEIPSPKKDVQKFLNAHQALTEIIESALAKANANRDPYTISKHPNQSLSFPQKWRGAEVGVMTDGTKTGFPDAGKFAYGGPSFLTDLLAIDGTNNSFYKVVKPDGSVPAIIGAQPTAIPCVNRLVLAASDTAGVWAPPTYALGGKDGKAFLVVNKCIDLATSKTVSGEKVLTPVAELFTAIQWAECAELSHMNTSDKGHTHQGK
jgi:hypothetical protein